MAQRNRYGITPLELLVVLAIAGLLLAMLIPAVQQIRESSRRTACQNNLHQVAIAVQGSEASRGAVPPLYYGSFVKHPRSIFHEWHFHSWQTAILPELEQQNLHEQLDLQLAASDQANEAFVKTDLPVFICPSTSNYTAKVPEVYSLQNGVPTLTDQSAARSDYEAIGGVYFPVPGPADVQRSLAGVHLGVWGEPQYHRRTGKWVGVRTARFRDVLDGLSHTMIVGERAGRPDLYRRGKAPLPFPPDPNPRVRDHHQAAWGISTQFWDLVFPNDQRINETNYQGGIYGFHIGGANIAFADGAVRFLEDQTDVQVLQALATRSGGETVRLQ